MMHAGGMGGGGRSKREGTYVYIELTHFLVHHVYPTGKKVQAFYRLYLYENKSFASNKKKEKKKNWNQKGYHKVNLCDDL